MAERIGDPALIGDALHASWAAPRCRRRPARAYEEVLRARSICSRASAIRGQARAYGNLGVAAQFESRLDEAFDAYGKAIAVARAAGMPDLWGLAAMNTGVLVQTVRRVRSRPRAFRRGLGAVRRGEAQRVSARCALQHGARRTRARGLGVGVRVV